MDVTHITLQETIPNTDGAFAAEVRLAKERMTATLLSRLIEDPLLFTTTTTDSGSVKVKLAVVVASSEAMLAYHRRLEQLRLIVKQL